MGAALSASHLHDARQEHADGEGDLDEVVYEGHGDGAQGGGDGAMSSESVGANLNLNERRVL